MSDSALRNAERSGDLAQLYREQIRHGVMIPLSLPEPCAWGEASARDVVQLRAYLGDEASRAVFPVPIREMFPSTNRGCPIAWRVVEAWTLKAWTVSLLRLAEPLPPVRVEVACAGQCYKPYSTGEFKARYRNVAPHKSPCTGRRTHETPAPRYLAVRIALAVGREVLPGWEADPLHWEHLSDCILDGTGFDTPMVALDCRCPKNPNPRPRLALDACAAWAACPCPEHGNVHQLVNPPQHRPNWAWQPLCMIYAWDGAGRKGLGVALTSAAQLLKPERVRTVAQQAVLGILDG